MTTSKWIVDELARIEKANLATYEWLRYQHPESQLQWLALSHFEVAREEHKLVWMAYNL